MKESLVRAVAQRVQQLCAQGGPSQQAPADMARGSRPQLSEIETGAKPANTRRLAAIAVALRVAVPEVFTDSRRDAPAGAGVAIVSVLPQAGRVAVHRIAKAWRHKGKSARDQVRPHPPSVQST